MRIINQISTIKTTTTTPIATRLRHLRKAVLNLQLLNEGRASSRKLQVARKRQHNPPLQMKRSRQLQLLLRHSKRKQKLSVHSTNNSTKSKTIMAQAAAMLTRLWLVQLEIEMLTTRALMKKRRKRVTSRRPSIQLVSRKMQADQHYNYLRSISKNYSSTVAMDSLCSRQAAELER